MGVDAGDRGRGEGGAAEHWRLFVAIDLGAEARAALANAQSALRRQRLPVRWVEPGGAHLTIKFLGGVERGRVAALIGALHGGAGAGRPFVLRTGPPGAFPNARRPRVLWLGLAGPLDRLAALHRATEEALAPLGFPPEDRPFRPHLTLGRARLDAAAEDWAGLAAAFAALRDATPAPLPVEALRLMRSELGREGARYTTLATAPLGAAAAPRP